MLEAVELEEMDLQTLIQVLVAQQILGEAVVVGVMLLLGSKTSEAVAELEAIDVLFQAKVLVAVLRLNLR